MGQKIEGLLAHASKITSSSSSSPNAVVSIEEDVEHLSPEALKQLLAQLQKAAGNDASVSQGGTASFIASASEGEDGEKIKIGRMGVFVEGEGWVFSDIELSPESFKRRPASSSKSSSSPPSLSGKPRDALDGPSRKLLEDKIREFVDVAEKAILSRLSKTSPGSSSNPFSDSESSSSPFSTESGTGSSDFLERILSVPGRSSSLRFKTDKDEPSSPSSSDLKSSDKTTRKASSSVSSSPQPQAPETSSPFAPAGEWEDLIDEDAANQSSNHNIEMLEKALKRYKLRGLAGPRVLSRSRGPIREVREKRSDRESETIVMGEGEGTSDAVGAGAEAQNVNHRVVEMDSVKRKRKKKISKHKYKKRRKLQRFLRKRQGKT